MINVNYKRGLVYSLALWSINHPIALTKVATKASKKVVATTTPAKNIISEPSVTNDNKKVDRTDTKELQREVEAENALNRALLEKKLANVMAQIEQLRLEKERKRLNKEIEEDQLREAHEKEMRLLQMEKEKLMLEMELLQVRLSRKLAERRMEITELELKTQLERGNTQLLQEGRSRLQAEVDVLRTQEEREKHIAKKPIYLKDPLRKKDNVLVLSDRCIELTGYISPWKAAYIADQIQFFNNKNTVYPIFMVIDISPGGSVMSMWNILQAMERSKAPIYVVVKGYAASAAAMITTLAARSYAYPNALILHHQPLMYNTWFSNVRDAKESYEALKKLWERLGGKVAKKMGISLKAFDKKLYEKSMYGDWKEYADQAKKLKWVDHVVRGIEESAVCKFPVEADYTCESFWKKYYGMDGTTPEETAHGCTWAPYDFDYTYRPVHRQAAPNYNQVATSK